MQLLEHTRPGPESQSLTSAASQGTLQGAIPLSQGIIGGQTEPLTSRTATTTTGTGGSGLILPLTSVVSPPATATGFIPLHAVPGLAGKLATVALADQQVANAAPGPTSSHASGIMMQALPLPLTRQPSQLRPAADSELMMMPAARETDLPLLVQNARSGNAPSSATAAVMQAHGGHSSDAAGSSRDRLEDENRQEANTLPTGESPSGYGSGSASGSASGAGSGVESAAHTQSPPVRQHQSDHYDAASSVSTGAHALLSPSAASRGSASSGASSGLTNAARAGGMTSSSINNTIGRGSGGTNGAMARGPGAGTASSVDPAMQALRVCVAEDSLVNQRLVRRLLAKMGVTDPVIANDGVEATDAALAEPGFDVILMVSLYASAARGASTRSRAWHSIRQVTMHSAPDSLLTGAWLVYTALSFSQFRSLLSLCLPH